MRLCLTLQFCCLSLFATNVLAVPITYHFVDYPADQDGHFISGQITTDGTLGVLSPSNITSWNASITGPNSALFSNLDPNSAVLMSAGATTATPTQILFDPLLTSGVFLNFLRDSSGGAGQLFWQGFSGGNHKYAGWTISATAEWDTQPAVMNGSTPWIIAEVPPVPEPSTLTLAALGFLALIRRRRRK